MKKYFIPPVVLVILFFTISLSHATPVTFFGEDLNNSFDVRLSSHPNSDAAKNNFFSHLIGVGTENFENLSGDVPLTVSFGYSTATLSQAGTIVSIPSGTNGFGRYPISGSKYLETDNTFRLDFNTPQAAFGFYGVDIGDFGSSLTITYSNGTTSTTIPIGNTIHYNDGSVLYFGFYDTALPFTSITFGTTNTEDSFGFDDFSIGTPDQVRTPEPATFLLFGAGLAGLAAMRRKFRR